MCGLFEPSLTHNLYLILESSSGKLPENKESMEAKEGKGVKRRKTEDGNKAENLEETESSKEEEKSGTSKCCEFPHYELIDDSHYVVSLHYGDSQGCML